MTKIYYKVTSMEQLQKAYDIIHPDRGTMLYRYINRSGWSWKGDGENIKDCLANHHRIYFDTEGFATSAIRYDPANITVIDVKLDRYNL